MRITRASVGRYNDGAGEAKDLAEECHEMPNPNHLACAHWAALIFCVLGFIEGDQMLIALTCLLSLIARGLDNRLPKEA